MNDGIENGFSLLTELFGGWRFPVFAITFLFCAAALLLATLAIPPAETPLSAFAEEFKTWCFGYDPATGEMEMAYVVILLVNPLVLISIILGVWWEPLKIARSQPRSTLRWVVAAIVSVGIAAVGLGVTWGDVAPENTEFPAAALRTAHDPPQFSFADQDGNPVSVDDFRGKVVVLTGVYASCGLACPMILGQAKRAIEALPEAERDKVTVIGVTLDPENDTRERLAEMANAQQVSAPRFHLVNGPVDEINRVLDILNIARKRDPETGIIDHANLFLVVDPNGKIAYRFTLSERQEKWLIEALKRLVRETPNG